MIINVSVIQLLILRSKVTLRIELKVHTYINSTQFKFSKEVKRIHYTLFIHIIKK